MSGRLSVQLFVVGPSRVGKSSFALRLRDSHKFSSEVQRLSKPKWQAFIPGVQVLNVNTSSGTCLILLKEVHSPDFVKLDSDSYNGLILCVSAEEREKSAQSVDTWTKFVNKQNTEKKRKFFAFIVGLDCDPMSVDTENKIGSTWVPITSSLVIPSVLRATAKYVATECVRLAQKTGKHKVVGQNHKENDLSEYLLDKAKRPESENWCDYFKRAVCVFSGQPD
jgi:hypothetical protein